MKKQTKSFRKKIGNERGDLDYVVRRVTKNEVELDMGSNISAVGYTNDLNFVEANKKNQLNPI